MNKLIKGVLRLDAARQLDAHGIGICPMPREPEIVRDHVDGPYLRKLNGGLHWLTLWERLLTKLRWWDAWDIEARNSPVFGTKSKWDAS